MSTVDDRDLERYLRGDDAVSRAYSELKAERPSPALDQAVLARARDALKSAGSARAPRSHNWPVLTALAATVLLSFGLVMRLALEPESQVPTASPAQDAASTLPEESARPADAKEAASSEPHASSTPFGGTARDTDAGTSSIEEQRPQIEAEIRERAEQAPAVPEPVPPPAVATTPAYATPPAPSARGARSDAPATQPLRQEQGSEASSAERDLMRLEKAQEQAPAPAITAVSEGDRSSSNQPRSAALADEIILTPEAWLAEIARLRAAGETEAAEREFELFRKAYPDHPETLQQVDPAPERK
jgi:hypothetical protein